MAKAAASATARSTGAAGPASRSATGKSSRAGTKALPPPPFAARLARLQAGLPGADLDHFLVTNPLDVGYLTGFLGGDSYLLIGPAGSEALSILISDFRYREELEQHLAAAGALFRVILRPRSMGEAIAELLSTPAVGRCGFQAEVMTVAERDALAKKAGKNKLVATTGVLTRMRVIKDAHEIALIRRAIQIQEQALEAVLPTVEPGQTEAQVAARLEAEMKSRGASGPGFATIVAARANGSLPHYRPQDVKLAANQAVLIDWGAIYRGYHSDMTRTFALGKWPKALAEIYPIVLDAHEKAAAALAPGKTTTEIDKIARDHIAAAGYGDKFGHGLGHGLGLNGHEDPRLSHMLAAAPLEAGQVVTIEPGIYLPGVGGVRIEDDYVLTAAGAENLCSLPRTQAWSTLA